MIQLRLLHPDAGETPEEDVAAFIRLNAAFNGVTLTPAQVRVNLQTAIDKVVLAELDGRVCGFACVQIWKQVCYVELVAEVTELFVESEARRHGVGRALMLRAEQMAREAGAQEIRVATGLDNLPAQALYHGLGFADDALQLQKSL